MISRGVNRAVRRNTLVRSVLVLAVAVGLAALAATSGSASALQANSSTTTTSCQLGNGVQHVINIVFDNVHFARDNPNVPSDLEQMPHLLSFLESNGTVF
jgi:uncharacterized membrane protein